MASAQDIKNRVPITAALMLATLMNTLDSTIANVALPHMQGSLSASAEQIFWVLTSYIIATAIMTPLAGWLSLRFGRKPMFLISIAAFTVASMLCGVATSLQEIVIFRLIQGLAGASLMPLSQTVMLDIFPLAMVPRVMSIWSAAVILGPIIGPALGGWLTESLSWRWVFYINLPIEAGVAIVGFILFLVQTLTVEHPFFHRDLAKNRNFVACTLFGMFVGALLFSTSALLPSFMQTLLGYSALQSGYASMPRGVGSFCAFLLVPTLISSVGARPVLAMGIVLCVLALWQMAHFDLLMTAAPIMSSGVVQGFGVGLLFAPLNSLAYATLNPIHRTEATIVNTMARSLGSSMGISFLQASVVRNASIAHARLTEHVTAGSSMLASALPARVDPGSAIGMQLLNGMVTRQAAMVSYNTVFAWMALATLALIPLLLTMRAARGGPPVIQEMHGD
jgi:DHA2 family multidrug resistance protein